MPPISRMIASPTTVTPRAEIWPPISVRLETVRKWLLSIPPTTSRMTSTGSSAASRSQLTAAAERLRSAPTATEPLVSVWVMT
jgi:hypothetical protein